MSSVAVLDQDALRFLMQKSRGINHLGKGDAFSPPVLNRTSQKRRGHWIWVSEHVLFPCSLPEPHRTLMWFPYLSRVVMLRLFTKDRSTTSGFRSLVSSFPCRVNNANVEFNGPAASINELASRLGTATITRFNINLAIKRTCLCHIGTASILYPRICNAFFCKTAFQA
ncbi:hypothetical protein BDN67DRAFT_979447 [Paxillus ammoniavirescens]|nr:hypothetical protein BDN67DRAFT_979447 [Paxillus ammoniavirescens]